MCGDNCIVPFGIRHQCMYEQRRWIGLFSLKQSLNTFTHTEHISDTHFPVSAAVSVCSVLRACVCVCVPKVKSSECPHLLCMCVVSVRNAHNTRYAYTRLDSERFHYSFEGEERVLPTKNKQTKIAPT